MGDYNLLSVGLDPKTVKGEKKGYLTGILYLAPHDLAGPTVCPYSTPGCRASCLFTAGHGGMNSVQRARIRKTMLWHEDKQKFLEAIDEDILKLKRIAAKRGMTPCVRLNGTSDIPWENHMNIEAYGVQLYDYGKAKHRYENFLAGKLPKNYHLTYSYNENDTKEVIDKYLSRNGTVAIVFSTKKSEELPKEYNGWPVINGDLSDLRFLDERGKIVGLKAKGKAKHDATGFVIKV